jgi:hypothetical protein
VAQVWDVYLDADDAASLLHAAVTLERHRWVREPLPFSDVDRLLERLRKIASLAVDDARNWQFEAEDRLEESRADGGRWGSPQAATAMAVTALALAEGSKEVHEAVRAAVADLAPRIEPRPAPGAP